MPSDILYVTLIKKHHIYIYILFSFKKENAFMRQIYKLYKIYNKKRKLVDGYENAYFLRFLFYNFFLWFDMQSVEYTMPRRAEHTCVLPVKSRSSSRRRKGEGKSKETEV